MSIEGSNRVRRSDVLMVVGAAIGMAGGFAVLFSGAFGIFVKPVSASLGWSRSEVSLIPTFGFLGYALGGPVLGGLIDRIGAQRVFITGILVFAAALGSLAILPGSLAWFAGASLIAGIAGAATAPSGYVLILAKRFSTRLGLAIGLSMVGLGLGMVTIPSIAQALITAFGWRGAYLVLAAVALVFGCVALLLGAARLEATIAPTSTADHSVPAVEGATMRDALASWRFWLIGVTAIIVGIAGFGGAANLAATLSDRGVAVATAARIAGLTGAGLFLGRIGAAFLMDRIFAPLVAMGCCVLGGVGLLLLTVAPIDQPVLLCIAALLTGLPVGSEGDTMPFLTRRYFGVASFGSIYGVIIGMAAIGGILGPMAFGLSFDATGSYATMLKLAAALCSVSGISLLLLGRYRYDADNRARPIG